MWPLQRPLPCGSEAIGTSQRENCGPGKQLVHLNPRIAGRPVLTLSRVDEQAEDRCERGSAIDSGGRGQLLSVSVNYLLRKLQRQP
jgi:hypothetical protein